MIQPYVRLLCVAFFGHVSVAQNAPPLEQRVHALYDAGKWPEAARLADTEQPPCAGVLFYKGLSLAKLKNFAAATAAFKEGEKTFPKDKRFPVELAGIAYLEKDNRAAKRYLRRALQLDATDKYAVDFLATLYLLDQNTEATLKYWNRIGKPLIQELRFEPQPPLAPLIRDRAFDISGGQVLTVKRLEQTEANLNRLHVLSELHFEIAPGQGERSDLIIRSVPIAQPFAGWAGRILPILRELPYQGIAFDLYNMQRKAINFSSLERWDPNKRRVNLEISGPLHGNPRFEYEYVLDARDETWDLPSTIYRAPAPIGGLRLRRTEAGTNFEAGLSPKLQWTLGGRVSYRDYSHVQHSSPFSNGWLAEIDNRIDYLLWTRPEDRIRVNGWGSFDAGRLFSATPSRIVRTRAGLMGEWKPGASGSTWHIAEQTQGGRMFGDAPLDELFSLGMERDNDYALWLRGIAGTRDGRKGNAPLGREYGISQTDAGRRIWQAPLIRVEAGPFFDAGWTGDAMQVFGTREIRYDTGVQMKVRTAGAVTVRLVYGRDLATGRGAFYTAVSR